MQNKKIINLKANHEVKICTCGKTNNLPFCDESHKEYNEENNSNYKSLRITPEKDIVLNLSSKSWENHEN